MSPRRAACALLVVILGIGAVVPAQMAVDRGKHKDVGEELLYLPNEKLLNHFTGGMSSVIADLLWLRCIQYTSTHFKGDHKFVWLEHMSRTITRLDPNFVDVYRYGGIFLAALKSDDDSSIELMEDGFRRNPEAWELPYEIAMVYLLNRRDEPGSAEKAAKYLAMSVSTERAPQSVVSILQGLQRKHNMMDLERQLWSDIRDSSKEEFMRDLAQRKLQELTLRQNVDALNAIAQQCAAQTGRPVASLDELVSAGFMDTLPTDPLGGSFFIAPDGKVENTTLLDATLERRLDVLRGQIASFREQCGRFPATLQEMVDLKVVPSIPKHPYPDRAWSYEPATGEVS